MLGGAVGLIPLRNALGTKRAGGVLSTEVAEAARKAVWRAPVEAGRLRAAVFGISAVLVAVRLVHRKFLPWPDAAGLVTMAVLYATAAGLIRILVWQRLLREARRAILPNVDPLRTFASTYRHRLGRMSLALFGLSHAVIAALAAVFTPLDAHGAAIMVALTGPAMVVPMAIWGRSLFRRTLPIERYLDTAVRYPPVRGPARDDPRAIEAFKAAQSIPYRLAQYQAVWAALVGLAVIGLGRRFVGFDTATAARLLGVMAVILLGAALYQSLLLRDVLRPLLGQLGARHRLPVAEVRAAAGLRGKLIVFFTTVVAMTSGLVVLFALSPARQTQTLIASIALAFALSLGLVLLIVRDIVTPIRALEQRTEDMARGELAQPRAPGGRGRRDRPADLRARGDAARAAREAALDRGGEPRPRARGAAAHRRPGQEEPRAAPTRWRSCAARRTSWCAARRWPRWAGWSPASRTRSTTRSTRSSTRSARSRRLLGGLVNAATPRPPTSARGQPRRRGDARASSSAARPAPRPSCRRCTTTRAPTTRASARGEPHPQPRGLAGSAAPPAEERSRRVGRGSRPARGGLAGQINQVLMNLLTNAAQAVGRARRRRTIWIAHHGARRRRRASRSPSRQRPRHPARASCRASSTRSSPPRTSARAPAWACRSCTASSSATAATSRSPAPPARARASRSGCRGWGCRRRGPRCPARPASGTLGDRRSACSDARLRRWRRGNPPNTRADTTKAARRPAGSAPSPSRHQPPRVPRASPARDACGVPRRRRAPPSARAAVAGIRVVSPAAPHARADATQDQQREPRREHPGPKHQRVTDAARARDVPDSPPRWS